MINQQYTTGEIHFLNISQGTKGTHSFFVFAYAKAFGLLQLRKDLCLLNSQYGPYSHLFNHVLWNFYSIIVFDWNEHTSFLRLVTRESHLSGLPWFAIHDEAFRVVDVANHGNENGILLSLPQCDDWLFSPTSLIFYKKPDFNVVLVLQSFLWLYHAFSPTPRTRKSDRKSSARFFCLVLPVWYCTSGALVLSLFTYHGYEKNNLLPVVWPR